MIIFSYDNYIIIINYNIDILFIYSFDLEMQSNLYSLVSDRIPPNEKTVFNLKPKATQTRAPN